MSEPSQRVSPAASDYGSWYYTHGCGAEYDPALPHWQEFFGEIADRIITLLRPRTVLDAGCAMGILVGSLRERGVDASGVDVSDYAISKADRRAVGHVRVGDLTEPLEGRYDLIACVEVLEHIEPGLVEKVVSNLVAATDKILLSTTPEDFREGTHVNVRPPAYWAALFADHGFHRRFDVDASFLTPWAVLLQRRDATPRELVSDYETVLWDLRRENRITRVAVLERDRMLGGSADPAGLVAEVAELREAVLRERNRVEQAEQDLRTARQKAENATKRLSAVQGSTTYRVSRKLARLAAPLRRRKR
jgi:SAM-dependent methyltransferase